MVVFVAMSYHGLAKARYGVCGPKWEVSSVEGYKLLPTSNSIRQLNGDRLAAWGHRVGDGAQDLRDKDSGTTDTSKHPFVVGEASGHFW